MRYCLPLLFFHLPMAASAALYVFVSHSMGDEALKAYDREAKRHGGTLVMRGLLNDSFVQTKEKADRLKITYDINPQLFDEYQVRSVPVIVETHPTPQKISGHIPLKEALYAFQKEGG